MRDLARALAVRYGFQPSEIDRMTCADLLWWLGSD